MSSATETLCGQAFGAGQHYMMGIYLQRSWIINMVTATLLLPVFIFSGKLFKLIGEEEEIADAAGYIALWFAPILYFFCFAFPLQKFLQCQLKNMIVGWLSAVSFVLHMILSWIFVSKLNWGIPGAMSSMIISSWLVIIGGVVYVFGGWCGNTWKGFTSASLSDLIPVVKLSISSGIMLCLEVWYNALLVLLAGYMKNATTELSALSICLNISSWELMLCVGFLTSASVRVGNELGRGDAKAAKFSVKVILSSSVLMGVFFFVICLAFDRDMAKIFTTKENVMEAVSDLSILLAFSVLLNSVQALLTGVAVGSGRQGTVAYINIASYYLGGVPIGVILGYVAHLQIKGIWIGMVVGVVLQVLILGYITARTNWDEQVKKASDRLNRWSLKSSEEFDDEDSIRERLNG
ncbi:protein DETOXIFICATION 24 isoform X3 [Jatropha curcas]|nr:protein DETOXIFICATION 24 isoform X3 [Jatropha curcas]